MLLQMISMERGKYYMGGKVEGLALPTRVFPCATPAGGRPAAPGVAGQGQSSNHACMHACMHAITHAVRILVSGLLLAQPAASSPAQPGLA
jgi:hypothetical protein